MIGPEADITPRLNQVTVDAYTNFHLPVNVDEHGLSLPSSQAFNSSLLSFSPRLTNAYLVTRIIQCARKSEFPCAYLCSMSDDWISGHQSF